MNTGSLQCHATSRLQTSMPPNTGNHNRRSRLLGVIALATQPSTQ